VLPPGRSQPTRAPGPVARGSLNVGSIVKRASIWPASKAWICNERVDLHDLTSCDGSMKGRKRSCRLFRWVAPCRLPIFRPFKSAIVLNGRRAAQAGCSQSGDASRNTAGTASETPVRFAPRAGSW